MTNDKRITFLGAAGTVTGSKYLIEAGDATLLVDAGLFQGDRRWREKNWDEVPFDLNKLDAVLITHAHIDHIGMLPRYRHLGLKCPIYLTPPSAALARLLLADSGRLQEEEAQYRRERGKSRHQPPLPLYTERDAIDVFPLLQTVPFDTSFKIMPGVSAQWSRMGHILGAASIQLTVHGTRITFSGDIGRYHVPILKDPQPVDLGDLLLIESTYGDREHAEEDPEMLLGEIVNRTAARGGVVVIPAFAVGRCQLMLYYLRELKEKRAIPDIPVIIDSPMAADATSLYSQFTAEYDDQMSQRLRGKGSPFGFPKLHFIKDRNESIKLNSIDEPMILISASGMLSGGRILHHLKHRIADHKNTILFVGFQPKGGRGDWIKSGAASLQLVGDEIPIRAEIAEISSLSAHGDRSEMLRWLRSCRGAPKKVAVVHGEPDSAKHFAETLQEQFQYNTMVPSYRDRLDL